MDNHLTPAQIEKVHLIKRCCNNMDSIINDLLDYAKLANEKMELEQREFCFRDFINSVLDFNRPRINDKGLKLLFSVADDIPERVAGDEYRLTQILNNLISNAVQHGRPDSAIGISLRGFPDTVSYEVKNEAEPIPAAKLRTLFDPVKRFAIRPASERVASSTQNLGLGLYVAKQIVAAHDGEVSVRSSEHDGVIFSAKLPRLQPLRRNGD